MTTTKTGQHTYDVFRSENHSGGRCDHIGQVLAPDDDAALAEARGQFECHDSSYLWVARAGVHIGYVIDQDQRIWAQLPADNQFGFKLADDDQSWPGGLGCASHWQAITDDDPAITDADRERLQWLIDQARGDA